MSFLSCRDNAEKKVWSRLDYFKSLKRSRSRDTPPLKVGVLGCMAERLKRKLLESDKMVDLVAGPDAYRDLPRLLSVVQDGQSAGGRGGEGRGRGGVMAITVDTYDWSEPHIGTAEGIFSCPTFLSECCLVC